MMKTEIEFESDDVTPFGECGLKLFAEYIDAIAVMSLPLGSVG